MKAFRLSVDFCLPARDLDHAVELEERLFAAAQEMNIFWQYGSTDEIDPSEIKPESLLAKALG
jgi:hypothetical protein